MVEEGFFVEDFMSNASSVIVPSKLSSKKRDGRNVWDQEQNEIYCICPELLPMDFYMLA